MTAIVEHIDAVTWHGRKGAIDNAFRYSIDYVCLDPEADLKKPLFFGRNARGLMTLHDSDHGGAPQSGKGAAWVRDVLSAHDLPNAGCRLELLAQPRVLGHVFNPVSFWLVWDANDALRVVIAEVTNTFGDRHSYLCHREDHGPIQPTDTLTAQKIFHVSPFQPIEGGYAFRFDLAEGKVLIRIDYTSGNGGLIATLAGRRKALGVGTILRAMVRRPLGSRRVLALIHWQAAKLWWKGARYRVRPEPPLDEVSR